MLATTAGSKEIGIAGCDYEVLTDVAGKPAQVRLLGLPGTTAKVSIPAQQRKFSKATLDGGDAKDLLAGKEITVTFEGKPLTQPWHQKMSELPLTKLPDDAEALCEACFAADSNALEARSVERSGPTKIPAVKAARDAFFQQRTFVGRGLWDRYLFDGDPSAPFLFPSAGMPIPASTKMPPCVWTSVL